MPAPLEEKTESDSSAFGICVVPAIDDTPTVAGDAVAEQEILPTDPVLVEDIKELQAPEEDIVERSAPMEEKAKSSADTSEVFLYMIEIRKLKELLDEGILTQEEFDAKKKQLLGI